MLSVVCGFLLVFIGVCRVMKLVRLCLWVLLSIMVVVRLICG